MELRVWKRNTLLRRLFLVSALVGTAPVVAVWVYLRLGDPSAWAAEGGVPLLPFLGFVFVALILAGLGAVYLSHRIKEPILHFIRSATEIARGNFSQKVEVSSEDEIGRLAKIFNYMTTELRRLNELNLHKIINEKNKTETIIKNIADGVIVTDPANRVIMLNSVAEQWFGIREKDVMHTPLEEFIPNEDLLEFIREVHTNGVMQKPNVEIPIRPRGLKEIFLQARAARVVNNEGNLLGIVTILRDVTREKEIDRMKTELVSMVAHELRSPLTSISGFSELLLDRSVDSEQAHEYASIILKESNRLSDLINKYLDISRIESGRSQLKKVPLDVREVIEKVLDINRQQADKKNIKVAVDVPPTLTAVSADREMVEQVVVNLFTNAVKYSPENTEITIRVIERPAEVLVEVEDHGYGIPEKSLGKIFDKFYRVSENANVRDTAGSGLGLSLVKEIVEVHGGEITVRSEVGVGSTFAFTLPKSTEAIPEPLDEGMLY
jgi:PAS domain S-box-containing protein